jgi:mono/diheme cytochrome c family protein
LTQASVLTVSSYPNRTSPVLRGKWILENLLAAPPPDPPAGTPRLDESKIASNGSLRQQMEAHRTDATCAACHQRMDPLGFALENYDAIGGWRNEDGAFAIDASGKLPDGRTFSGPSEMKTILKGDRDAFALAITEKMLTYALGRGLERYDRRTVKAIAKGLAARDYRFSALVDEIVTSPPFRMRRGDVVDPTSTVARSGASK